MHNSRNLLLVSLASLTLMLLFALLTTYYDFSRAEQEELDESMRQTKALLQEQLHLLNITNSEYSAWDATYHFVTGHNREYIDSSLGQSFMEPIRLNLYAVIDTSGIVLFSRAAGRLSSKAGSKESVLQQLLAVHPETTRHRSEESIAAGFVSTPSGMLMISSRPILTTAKGGPIAGTLIIGRLMDEGELERIGALLGYSLSIFPSKGPSRPEWIDAVSAEIADRSRTLIRRMPNGLTESFSFLDTTPSLETGIIKLQRERPFLKLEDHSIRIQLIWFLSLLVFLVTAVAIFNRHILKSRKAEQDSKEAISKQRDIISSMSIELSLAEERERCRIAGSMHDSVGPGLLVAKMKIDQLIAAGYPSRDLEPVTEQLTRSIEEVRSLTFQLMPPFLNNGDFKTATKWLVKEFEQNFGFSIHFTDDDQPKPLSHSRRSVLFQCIRELLLNIAKHAGGQATAKLFLKRQSDMVLVIVEDNGIGFNYGEEDDSFTLRGFGLYNVKRKMEYFGGTLTVESAIGKGTAATLALPLYLPGTEEAPQ